MKQIAVFASGAGSNAARIIDHFRRHPAIKVALVVCNKPGAGVLRIAESAGIPTLMIEKDPFFPGGWVCQRAEGPGCRFYRAGRVFMEDPYGPDKRLPGKDHQYPPGPVAEVWGKGHVWPLCP